MTANLKVYKYLGYLFPIIMISALVTQIPGTLALVFYWVVCSKVRKSYVRRLDSEINTLKNMQTEVILLIKTCNENNKQSQ